MNAIKSLQEKEKLRVAVAARVRDLRRQRRWTQAELAKHLGLSQARLSEIENGDGSFSAEQFLLILKLFNVPVSDFAPAKKDVSPESKLQNALARLGARFLQESEDVLPSEQHDDANSVIREALITGAPRLVTAVGPVLVNNIDNIYLKRLEAQLAETGLDRRLGWVADNVHAVLQSEAAVGLRTSWTKQERRAVVLLGSFLEDASSRIPPVPAPDILDRDIRSKKTLASVQAESSPISKRWGIVTSLQPEDFAKALRDSRAAR